MNCSTTLDSPESDGVPGIQSFPIYKRLEQEDGSGEMGKPLNSTLPSICGSPRWLALRSFVGEWQALRDELGQASTALNKCMTTYQQILFPVVEQICVLDGTDAIQYSLAGMRKLRAPKPIVVLQAEVKQDKTAEEVMPQALDERKADQATIAIQDESLLCPSCQTPHRENARFCNHCGQALVETEALPRIVAEAGDEYATLSLAELRQKKTPEAAAERYRRAVDAIIAYNATVDLPLRWYINVVAVRQLVGGRAPNVQDYLDTRRAEIEAHHHKHRLLPAQNRGKAIAITECIPIPDPQGAS